MHKLYFTVDMEILILYLILGMVIALIILADRTKKLGSRFKHYKERLERLELGTGNDVADGALERPGNAGK